MSAEEGRSVEVHNASASDTEGEHSDDSLGSPGSKKRKRNQKISCELCKARKVKCDRAEPSCGWCARNKRVCVYQERKKPGLRIAHVHELEDKVNRLEAVLHSLGRRVEEHISEHDALHHRNSNQLYHGPGLTPRSEPLSRSIGGPSDTLSQRSPTIDAPWQPNGYSRDQRRNHQLPEPMSVRSVIDPPSLQRPRSYTSTAVVETPQSAIDAELPAYDLVYSLVDLFFKHVNPWSPILDRKSTFDTLFGGTRLTEADQVLMHAIVATTLRFSKDSRLTPESRQRYHDSSKTKILLHGIQYPSVQALQALLILAIDLLGYSCDGSGMTLIALITRNITSLGLGIEKAVYLSNPNYQPINIPHHFTQSRPDSWIEEEGRRRLVWMAYILDRYTAVSTRSSFIFSDDDMDRRLPCTYDLFSRSQHVPTRWPHITHRLNSSPSPQENLGSFSYHCEVLTILSRVHDFLRQPLDLYSVSAIESWRNEYINLDAELNAWLASLPGEYSKISQLCHSDPGSKISNWIMLHAAFVTAVIRLHSAAAYPTAHSPLFTPSFAAMHRCLGAVESLREIARDTINNGMLDLLGPPFAFSLWTSARLLLVHAATVDHQPSENPSTHFDKIDFFTSTLAAMGQHWRLASIYAETLNRVVLEGQHASLSGADAATSHSASQSVGVNARPRTFKQMRKTAYDLSTYLSQRQHPDSSTSQDHAPTQSPEANEMEYIDVFEFFDYPIVADRRRDTTIHDTTMRDQNHGHADQNHRHAEQNHRQGDQDYRRADGDNMRDDGNGNGNAIVAINGARRVQSPIDQFPVPRSESDWLASQGHGVSNPS